MAEYTDVRLYIRDHPGATKAELDAAFPEARAGAVRGALRTLSQRGIVRSEGTGSAERRYYAVRTPKVDPEPWVLPLDSTPRTVREIAEMMGMAGAEHNVRRVLMRREAKGRAVCDRIHGRPYRWTAGEVRT